MPTLRLPEVQSLCGTAQPFVKLLGAPHLQAEGGTIPMGCERRFQLLAFLALHDGQWVPRDRMAGLLWPDRPQGLARSNLRKVIFRLHGLPGLAALEVTEHGLRWPVANDVQAFKQAAAAEQAIAWATSDTTLLNGLDDGTNSVWSDWLAAERLRFAQLWRATALLQMQRLENPVERVDLAQRMLHVDPLDEDAVAALLRAAQASGNEAQAQRIFSNYAVRLAEALGVEPSLALRNLVHAPPPAAASGKEPATAPVHRAVALPAAPDFVGRKSDLAEFQAMLSRPECRQITILGPGGMGKSRFARQALAWVGPQFAGGAHWLELQSVHDNTDLLARLAQMLGVEVSDTRDQLPPIARCLGDGPTLLVLDNAEHLQDLPSLIDPLLLAAPELRLVLTSRTRVQGAFEWLLPLQGLAVPDEDSQDLEAASTFDAVRLFQARALAVQRQFRLDRHLPAVIEITQAVGGLPLAIELAANWVRLLPPEEIARELRQSMDVLERDPTAPAPPLRPEHQSMRAVLAQSWQLLAPSEQAAMAALSVFAGGFTVGAARRVALVPLPLLSALADKSLLASDETGRLGMHPLVAAFAAQTLDANPQAAVLARARHAEHFARHLAEVALHVLGDQRLLVAGVTSEYANCRAAWLWAVQHQRVDLVYDMVRALWSYFEIRSRYREGIELLSPALTLPDHHAAGPGAQTRLRHGLSMLHFRSGDLQLARSLALSGVAPGKDCGDTEAYIGCLLNTAMCLWAQGHAAEARPYYEEGLTVAQQRRDRHCTVWALGNLAVCLQALGDEDGAQAMLTQALAGARQAGDLYNTAVNLNNLGHLLVSRGRWSDAQTTLEEGLHHCRSHGLVSIELYLTAGLVHALIHRGLMQGAREIASTALERCQRLGLDDVEWAIQILLADIQIRSAEFGPALTRLARLVNRARALRFDRLAAMAVDAYGDLLLAQERPAQASAAWRSVVSLTALRTAQQKRVAEKLRQVEASGACCGEPAPATSFEDWLDLIERG